MVEQNSTFSKCSICFSEYDDNEDISVLNCGHKFHTKCIFDWLKSSNDNSKCAFCNTKLECFAMNNYGLNFNTDKIIKFKYDTVYCYKEPVYKEDLNINYGDIFLCCAVKKQLMNSIPAEFIDLGDNKHRPLFILKSMDNEHYKYISLYLRMLILFTPDNDNNKLLLQYFTSENKITYGDGFITFDCIIDKCISNVTFIGREDFYKYYHMMDIELTAFINKYKNYKKLNSIESCIILSDMFITNLKHLANTNNFIELTTLSDTRTQDDINKYKHSIYHTIALITVYGFLNMCNVDHCKIFNEHINDNDNDNDNDENIPDYELYCHDNLINYLKNRVNYMMETNLRGFIADRLINLFDLNFGNNNGNNGGNNGNDGDLEFNADDYIKYNQILPSVNYMYYEIMPQYSIKKFDVIIGFYDLTEHHNMIHNKGNFIIYNALFIIIVQLMTFGLSYQYDIDVYNKTNITKYIISDGKFNLDYDRALFITFLFKITSLMMSIYITISLILIIADIIEIYYCIIENYASLTNVNYITSILKNDTKFQINCFGGMCILIYAILSTYFTFTYFTKIFDNLNHIDNQIKNLTIV